MLAAAECLRHFDHPSLVIWAKEDRVMPLSHGRRLTDLLPHGRLIELADSYTLMPLDQQGKLAHAIRQFIPDARSPHCPFGRCQPLPHMVHSLEMRILLVKGYSFVAEQDTMHAVVLISANTEWRVVRSYYPEPELHLSPFGGWFVVTLEVGEQAEPVIFFHGGWGKIAAAAATQYVIDRWSPVLLINLGTCGGFEGEIAKGTILLVERTIVYDIVEMMSDYEAAIASYTTSLDLTWLGESYPHEVQRALLVSADRDVQVADIPHLKARYGAIAGDWESGAIAYVAARNNVRCLILRGVSDLVGEAGEAYGNVAVFHEGTRKVFQVVLRYLPAWIASATSSS